MSHNVDTVEGELLHQIITKLTLKGIVQRKLTGIENRVKR
jgi:hypothetical protein